MEQCFHQSTAEAIHVLVDEVREGGLRRNIKVLDDLSGKVVTAALLHRSPLHGYM